MTERIFDWRPRHDPRSREYPIRTALAGRRPRSYTWPCGTWLDQGREGACVGFAWSHELASVPVSLPVSTGFAQALYRQAQTLDPWPGEAYSGTSVLAGAQAMKLRGYLAEYRWAFGLEDLVATVGAFGPAVLGVPWFSDMFTPDNQGFIHASGSVIGGHAILCRGVNLRGEWAELHNSWGQDWGVTGRCRIGFADLGKLLAEDGEACIPVLRRKELRV